MPQPRQVPIVDRDARTLIQGLREDIDAAYVGANNTIPRGWLRPELKAELDALHAALEPPAIAASVAVKPSITGAPYVGTTLVGTRGVFNGTALTYSYAYERDGTPITAGSLDYTLLLEDVGDDIALRVTAQAHDSDGDPVGPPVSAVSDPVHPNALPTPTITAKLSADGDPVIEYTGENSDVVEVQIFRTTVSGGAATPLVALTPPNRSFEDNDSTNGVQYYYRAKFRGLNGLSAYSNEKQLKPTAPGVVIMGRSVANGAQIGTDFSFAVDVPVGCDTLFLPALFAVPSNDAGVDVAFTKADVDLDAVDAALLPNTSGKSTARPSFDRGGRVYVIKDPKPGPGTVTYSFKSGFTTGTMSGWAVYAKGVNGDVLASTDIDFTTTNPGANSITSTLTGTAGQPLLAFFSLRSQDTTVTTPDLNTTITRARLQGTNLLVGEVGRTASGGTDTMTIQWAKNGSGANGADQGFMVGIVPKAGAGGVTTAPSTFDIRTFLQNEMRGTSEVRPRFDINWARAPQARNVTPGTAFGAGVGWLVADEPLTGNPSPGAYLEARNLTVFLLTDTWALKETTKNPKGAFYDNTFILNDSKPSGTTMYSPSPSQQDVGSPVTGTRWRYLPHGNGLSGSAKTVDRCVHAYQKDRWEYPPGSIRGVIVVCDFRTAPDAPANAEYTACVAVDWWKTLTAQYAKPDGTWAGNNADGGISKFKGLGGAHTAPGQWRTFVMANGDLSTLPAELAALLVPEQCF